MPTARYTISARRQPIETSVAKSPYCDALRKRQCDELGNCGYKIKYLGAPPSSGSLSMDSFIFETYDNGFVTIPNGVFGCNHKSAEHPDLIMGVVGVCAKMTFWYVMNHSHKNSQSILSMYNFFADGSVILATHARRSYTLK